MKYKNIKNNKKRERRNLPKSAVWLILAVALIVAILSVIIVLHNHKKSASTTQLPTFTPTSTGQPVNLSPPTNEERQQADQSKSQITKDQATEPAAPSGTKTTASPFITYAAVQGQNVQVNGYVGGIFEDGGTCLATFTKGDLKVTGQSKGIADADHTTCPPITVPLSSFSSGTWSAVLSYASGTATGSSQARNVVIQ